MKILHVITGLGEASGVSTFVVNIVRELIALGHEAQAITTEAELARALEVQPDIVHIHGLWSPLLHHAAVGARRRGLCVVWSTHGMTAPWSLRHKWWKKIPAWLLYQKWDLRRAVAIHCTVEKEVEWNRALGFGRTFIAPLGTEVAPGIDRSTCSCATERTMLFVGRLYPVKALDLALRALALAGCPLRLRLVGPDQAGHRAELEALARDLRVADRVAFAGPKFGAALSAEYLACDGLFLVSHTENFGATVIDALACGKPVVTSTKTPWKIVAERGCGWWVDNAPETLAAAFEAFASATDEELAEMGRRGRALVEERYTWPAVARSLCAEYDKIMNR